MKKIYLIIAGLLLASGLLFADQVDVEEIRRGDQITFINYSGPYAYRETVLAIRGIGRRLARGLGTNNTEYRYLLKYSVIHASDDTTSDRFNADIISIDRDARVEHVRNVRLIIAGYLQNRYGYKRDDADTLAYFLTIYNAVYRGDVGYFQSKYKPVVTQHITAENAGLSTKYFEWAGNTKIIIPLMEGFAGEELNLDTTELTDEKVIEKLREDDDKGLEERKDMVEIKEKDLEEKKSDLEKEREGLKDDKEKIEKEEEKIEKEEEKLAEKKEELEKKREEAEKITDEKEKEKALKDIEKEETKVEKEEEKLTEKKEELEEKKEEVEKTEEDIKKEEEKIVEKTEEIEKEKEEIAKDEKEKDIVEDPDKVREEITEKEEKLAEKEKELEEKAKEQEKELEEKKKELAEKEELLEKKEEAIKKGETDENIVGLKLYYLKIKEYQTGGHYNNEMYIISVADNKILLKSPVDNISGRRYDHFSEGVVVITRDVSDDVNYHKLTLLDKDKLQVDKKGDEDIFWRSFVEVRGDYIYAIVKDGDSYYLGKFDNSMQAVARSTETVANDTFISFFNDMIYINGTNNAILVLNMEDLSLKEKIAP